MPDILDLPAADRAAHYLRLALDAVREAEKATGAVRASYLIIAEQFRKLAMASDAEANSGK